VRAVVMCRCSDEEVVARDGIEPSTFRFSVGGSTASGAHSDSVSSAFQSESFLYDSLRTKASHSMRKEFVRDVEVCKCNWGTYLLVPATLFSRGPKGRTLPP
jgi:hypothetical protein